MYPRLSHPSPPAAASHSATCRACLAVAAGVLTLAASAPRAATVDAERLAQCERAVRQALVPTSNKAAELSFSAAPSVLQAQSSDDQVVLQGEGQWRDGSAVRKFSYRCNLDPRSAEAVGVVIRQAAVQLPARAAPPPIEPDLSHLSPSACESSAALALKQRWPQVSKITFDPTTRSLKQYSASRAELHGRGRAQPAPQSQQLLHFGFDCALDPRDGRVLEVSLIG